MPRFIPILVLVALILTTTTSYARSYTRLKSSKASGMGNAFVSQYDEFSTYYNQAGLARIDRTSIAFFYENRFMIKELSVRSGLITYTTGSGNFALHYNTMGPSQWNESIAGLAYSRFLSEKLSAGLKLNYFGTRLPEDDKTAASASFELGFIYQLNSRSFLGIHLANPFASTISTISYEDQIPWSINLGGHTLFSEFFTLSYEIEKIEDETSQLKIGAEWEAAKNLYVRGGVNTHPFQFFTGFGYKSQFFSVDTAFSYHQYLGYTPSVSLKFSFF